MSLTSEIREQLRAVVDRNARLRAGLAAEPDRFRQCEAVKGDGGRCQLQATPGRLYCGTHSRMMRK